jgi:lipopolysaccharide/colanic/teichoic acid biosynthesis glycosyltransferase
MAFQDIEISRMLSLRAEAVDAPRSKEFGHIYASVGKRVLDTILAVLLLPILLPVLAVVWFLIQRDGGSAVFAQPRIGLNGRTFTCFKFRTMVVNAERVLEEMCAKDPEIAAEWHTYQKLRNDPRISKIGKILRATSLDELPQIFNVSRGDMSLVGPRPFLPSQQAIYDAAGGKAYYHMRPGITGPWQVFGRGATTFEARVSFDETYYSKLNFLADLSLIMRTARVVLCRTGA